MPSMGEVSRVNPRLSLAGSTAALPMPSRAPIHSPSIGTSFCSTWTTSTSGGEERGALGLAVEQLPRRNEIATIKRIIADLTGWRFILTSVDQKAFHPPVARIVG